MEWECERKTGHLREKWASAEKKTKKRSEVETARRKQMRERDEKSKSEIARRGGEKEGDSEVQVLTDHSSAPPSWSWENGVDRHASEPASELALKRRQ